MAIKEPFPDEVTSPGEVSVTVETLLAPVLKGVFSATGSIDILLGGATVPPPSFSISLLML